MSITAILNRERLLHYLEVFVAAFLVSAGANVDHVFGAHGLNAWKSLVLAAATAGGKAILEAYRKAAQPKQIHIAASAVPLLMTSSSGGVGGAGGATVNLLDRKIPESTTQAEAPAPEPPPAA